MVLRDFRPEGIWEALYREYYSHLDRRGLPLPRSISRRDDPVETPVS